ncbi:TolB family protein [Maribacter sp. 2307ULW6-5]|uniref:TolB family protein n=1 Tax=Maribacter sp. 2307ULW6-5 TaxID=3386275 RepID=UPI0039BC58C4
MNKILSPLNLFVCAFCFTVNGLVAQDVDTASLDGQEAPLPLREQQFLELKAMGYSQKEIYEDLGNVSFLSKQYASALYWYGKLQALMPGGKLAKNYQLRYDHAKAKMAGAGTEEEETEENWTELILEDYQMTHKYGNKPAYSSTQDQFLPLDIAMLKTDFAARAPATQNTRSDGRPGGTKAYQAPVALSPDGNTAYFAKEVLVRPATGLFSKKAKRSRIFRAKKTNGTWRTVAELPLCSADHSVTHPHLSPDGRNLFFASNMRGSFGEYDIYVAKIAPDGGLGIAKNLGPKVNSDKDDLYPQMMGNGTLVFASEGHGGFGGLDLYTARIGPRYVGLATNMGRPFNGPHNDVALHWNAETGTGYVVTDRAGSSGDPNGVLVVHQAREAHFKDLEQRLFEAVNDQAHFSSSLFQEE